MILVIPQLLLPILAVLCLEKIALTNDKKTLLPAFKKGAIAVGVTFAILFIIYFMSDFMSGSDKEIMTRIRLSNDAQWLQILNAFFDGMREDRKSLMIGSIFRSFGFALVAMAFVWLAIRKTISPMVLGVGLTVFALIDVIVIDVKYLGYDNYQEKQDNEGFFVKTKADSDLLADTSFYRVFNIGGFQENLTSYYHNSVGGYHAAKLAIYQDLIEHKLTKQQPNTSIFNMLNVKYFIRKGNNMQTEAYEKNDGALGNAWLVKNIQYVKDANAEMNALGNFNTKDTAVVQDAFKAFIPFEPVADSTATISRVANGDDHDLLTYTFNSATNQFAVFSEIYYKRGWKAYIDGKEAPIVKVNYVLRGLAVPAGKHDIRFEFKPAGYYKGKTITSIFTIILLVMFVAGVFMEWRNRKQTALANRV